MGGLAWSERINSISFLVVTVFVICLTYTLAFYLINSKQPWIIAGFFAAFFCVLATLPSFLQYGFFWQSMAVTALEWFVVASVAGLVAMLTVTPDHAA
jgi:hypothetical protein